MVTVQIRDEFVHGISTLIARNGFVMLVFHYRTLIVRNSNVIHNKLWLTDVKFEKITVTEVAKIRSFYCALCWQ